jgi:hypothetical protein
LHALLNAQLFLKGCVDWPPISLETRKAKATAKEVVQPKGLIELRCVIKEDRFPISHLPRERLVETDAGGGT